jgi:single-strand DNA-binding protein
MSRGLNKVMLIGNLGNGPETRYTQGGAAVTSIGIATNETWKDKQTGEKQERTEWHNVTFFGRLAEVAGEYLRKGSKVYVEGQLRTNSWEKDGQKHYKTEIIASEMQMLDSKGQGGGAPGGQQKPPPQRAAHPVSNPDSLKDFDDDIPF